MKSLGRILEMVRKEFRQIFRDSKLRRLIFISPMIQLIVFGYAVSTDVRHISTFVVDHDNSAVSRELVESLTASGYFDVVARSERPADLVSALDHGDAMVGVVIPSKFGDDLVSGTGAKVQFIFDGTNSNITTVAKGYAERITTAFGFAQASVAVPSMITLRDRAWFNPELESRNYNVPAVVGAIIMLVCLLLTALAVVREREIGTLEQLMVSPLQPFELMLGKTIPFAVIGLFDLALITAIAILWFDIPFRGNFVLLLAASILYLLSTLGLGLFISTIASTQQEAFLSSFLVFMPTMLLSGFMFPVRSMPPFFQWVTLINPMRHYLDIVRSIFLKGAELQHLLPQFAALTLIGAVILSLATLRFQKRIS